MATPAEQSPYELYKKKGNESHAAKNYKEAVKQYGKALEHASTDVERGIIYSNRSASLLELDKIDEALADAEQAIQLRPGWVKGYYRRGEVYRSKRQWQQALDAYKEAIAKEPSPTLHARVWEMGVELENEGMGLCLRQLLPGRDICLKTYNPISALVYQFARGMQNFIYLIGDAETRQALVVDCCWDYDGIMKAAKAEDLKIIGAIVTHYHFDHTGGKPPPPYDQYRISVDGVLTFAKKNASAPVYVGPGDYDQLHTHTGVPAANLVSTQDGQELRLGRTVVKFIHTPGHTPGSQCILINGKRLITGDSVFIGGCGRLDFPDSDAGRMYESMQKLRRLADDTVIYAGHNYGGHVTHIANEKRHGALAAISESQWLGRINPDAG